LPILFRPGRLSGQVSTCPTAVPIDGWLRWYTADNVRTCIRLVVSIWTVGYVRGLSMGLQLIGIREYGTDGCRLPASIKTPGIARIIIFFLVPSPRHSFATWRAVITRLNSAVVCWLGVMKVHADHPTRRSRCILHNCDKSTYCWLMYYHVVCSTPTTSPGPVLLENCTMSWWCWRFSMKINAKTTTTMNSLFCLPWWIYIVHPSITILRTVPLAEPWQVFPSSYGYLVAIQWDAICLVLVTIARWRLYCSFVAFWNSDLWSFTFHRRVVRLIFTLLILILLI